MKSKLIIKSLSILSICSPVMLVSCQNYSNSFAYQHENKVCDPKTCCLKDEKPEKIAITFDQDSIKLWAFVIEKEKKHDDSIQNDSKNKYYDHKDKENNSKNSKDKAAY